MEALYGKAALRLRAAGPHPQINSIILSHVGALRNHEPKHEPKQVLYTHLSLSASAAMGQSRVHTVSDAGIVSQLNLKFLAEEVSSKEY